MEQLLDQLWSINYITSCDGTNTGPAMIEQILDQLWGNKYLTKCYGKSI